MNKIMTVLTLFVAVFILFILPGCVTTDAKKGPGKPVFFPPPPDLPRFQFLTSFNSTSDFDDDSASELDKFLGGGNEKGYRLRKPYGVAMQTGAMYVVDTQTSVWKFDFKKSKIHKMAGDKGLGKLVQPINISVDPQGNKYVADPVRSAVIKYDKNDFYVRSYQSPDSWKPVSAKVFEDMLYVADSTNGKGGVKVFDVKSGELVDTFGLSGKPEHRLHIPTNLFFDDDGYLYVMDAGLFKVMKYDRDGHYRGHLGGPGDGPGYFGRPRGVAVDRSGRIYAVDAAFDVVQVFASSGQILTILGGSGTTPGTLTLPAGIILDYDSENLEYFKQFAAPGFEIEYLIIVTSQFHNTNGISVYGFGKMAEKSYPSDQELHDDLIEELKRKQAS